MDVSEKEGSAVISVKVVPRASRTEMVGLVEGALKVRIAAPPVDGAANVELAKILAKAFGVPRSGVEIIAGESSRNKRVILTGVSTGDARAILEKLFPA